MVTVETILKRNTVVRRLIEGGNITPEQLKKIYRALCKSTHPDVRAQDGRAFIRLHDEYEEALAHWDEIRSRLVGEDGADRLSAADIRKMFYAALRHYLAAGLYSQRARLKPEMKKRNELILREVLSRANRYRPEFIPVFLEFNKAHLRRYLDWRKKDNLAQARKIFIMGFNAIVDYQMFQSPQARRTARSFFTDCLAVLESVTPSAASRAIGQFAGWFLEELAALEAPSERKSNEQ